MANASPSHLLSRACKQASGFSRNYYNKSTQRNNGKMEVVLNLKGVGGRYNSFQKTPELLPFVDRSLVKSTEAIASKEPSAGKIKV
jgi:hypothetical protein